jgi:hypothetical protein
MVFLLSAHHSQDILLSLRTFLLTVYATEGNSTPVELPVALPVFEGAKEEDSEGYQ